MKNILQETCLNLAGLNTMVDKPREEISGVLLLWRLMLMETYWTALSGAYQIKVKEIAKDNSVDTNTVMRNLEGYLKNEKPGIYCSPNSFITIRELEALIDNIAQPTN